MFLTHLLDVNIMGLSVENNTIKPTYISQYLCLGPIQEMTHLNIEQLHSEQAVLAK